MTALLDATARQLLLAADLEGATAEDVVALSVSAIPRFAVASSFGADSAVLLSIVARVAPDVPVLFLDTGLHLPETLRYRHDLATRLGLRDVRDVRPRRSVAQQAAEHGVGLSFRDPDLCCALRKVAPLDEALAGFDGWATGVRRDQTLDRAGTPVVHEVVRSGRTLVKVAPLATWSAADVEDHLVAHDLPRHPLVARGFRSIGCGPCTRAVAPGEDVRAGRWADRGKVECGIHLEDAPGGRGA